MNGMLSLLFAMMLLGGFTLNFPIETLANEKSTAATTKGSLILDGWAEEPIESNMPTGPQGSSSLTDYTEGTGTRKILPQTNTSQNLLFRYSGITLLIFALFFVVSRKRLVFSKNEVIK